MNVLPGLCYNIPDQPIYGELTPHTLSKIARVLSIPPPLSPIHILDIGHGSGRALAHLAKSFTDCNVTVDVLHGVDVSYDRVLISKTVLPRMLKIIFKCKMKCPALTLESADVIDWKMLPPKITHTYSFDLAFGVILMTHIENLQRMAQELTHVITCNPKVYRQNHIIWGEYGRLRGIMHGSGNSVTLYIFRRVR
jgi:SAM-dependent methyltransferase